MSDDFYLFNDLLTEEQRMIRTTVRDFVDAEVLPIITEHYREGTFPRRLIPKMGELGFYGSTLEDYGCPGLDNVSYGLIMQELERGDSGVRSCASVQSALVMWPIHAYGSDEQKERWLPAMRTGEAIGCFGLTEPDHGSDPGGMETRAVADGDEYVLNGAKMWITNGSICDVALVWAKLDGKVRGFLVEADRDGFSAPEMKGKLSLRASITSELVMDDVRIPKSNMLPGVEGLRGPLSCLNQARYGIAWGAVGAMDACFTEARDYGLSRTQFDTPIAGFQLQQRKLTNMLTMMTKAQLLAWRLGLLKDEGRIEHQHISLAKRNNVHDALEVARMARTMLGANGVLDEYGAMRHASNLESVFTYEGTHDIHTLIVGEAITGIPSFRRKE